MISHQFPTSIILEFASRYFSTNKIIFFLAVLFDNSVFLVAFFFVFHKMRNSKTGYFVVNILWYYELNLSLRKINANLQLHKSRIVIHGRTKIIRFTGMFVIWVSSFRRMSAFAIMKEIVLNNKKGWDVHTWIWCK